MAVNFLMQFTANGQVLNGESKAARYETWIEVIAYEFAGQRGQAGSAGGGRMGAPTLGNFVLRKRVDSASPLLFKAFTNNEQCELKLVMRKSGGEMQDYMRIELKHGVIAKLVQGNLAFGGEMAEEEVHLSYQSLKMIYDVQDQKTGIVRGGIEHEYIVRGA